MKLSHAREDTLPIGAELWHVYSRPYEATAFNPHSESRFAARRPRRAMYCAGETAQVALWETVLRDVIADTDGCTVVFPGQLAGRVLARVRTVVPVRLVDLSMPRLRAHVGDDAELAEWQALQRTSDYPDTWQAASSVLAKKRTIGALKWTSKQAGNGAAYVFYAPPHDSDTFEVLGEHALDGRKRWYWIDAALAQAGIGRIRTDPKTLRGLT